MLCRGDGRAPHGAGADGRLGSPGAVTVAATFEQVGASSLVVLPDSSNTTGCTAENLTWLAGLPYEPSLRVPFPEAPALVGTNSTFSLAHRSAEQDFDLIRGASLDAKMESLAAQLLRMESQLRARGIVSEVC